MKAMKLRLSSAFVVLVGALYLARPASATPRPEVACGIVYCIQETSCPSEQWLLGYCAGKDCPGLPGCAEGIPVCNGRAAVYCNENVE